MLNRREVIISGAAIFAATGLPVSVMAKPQKPTYVACGYPTVMGHVLRDLRDGRVALEQVEHVITNQRQGVFDADPRQFVRRVFHHYFAHPLEGEEVMVEIFAELRQRLIIPQEEYPLLQ
jgi:hypothetical protein